MRWMDIVVVSGERRINVPPVKTVCGTLNAIDGVDDFKVGDIQSLLSGVPRLLGGNH